MYSYYISCVIGSSMYSTYMLKVLQLYDGSRNALSVEIFLTSVADGDL